MSVLINGMEMPRKCIRCPVNVYGRCLVNDDKDVSEATAYAVRDKDCPLVPVPEHGRLGDFDRLEQMFVDIDNAPYSGFDGSEPFYSAEDAAQIIRLAPTIIEEE